MADEQDAKVLLSEALFGDAETRPGMEDLIVKKFPKAAATIPGFQQRKAVDARLAELDAKIAAFDQREAADKFRREVEGEWRAVVDLGIVTDEDRAEVEKIMAERRTANYEDAAQRLAASRRVAAPRSDGRTMQIPGVKGAGGDWYKGIVDNPEVWAREHADTILEDFAKGQGAKHL